jgi:hypothetical protein
MTCVFDVDIETCRASSAVIRIIACIEDTVVIEKLLTQLDKQGASAEAYRLPPRWAPPAA